MVVAEEARGALGPDAVDIDIGGPLSLFWDPIASGQLSRPPFTTAAAS